MIPNKPAPIGQVRGSWDKKLHPDPVYNKTINSGRQNCTTCGFFDITEWHTIDRKLQRQCAKGINHGSYWDIRVGEDCRFYKKKEE